MGPWLIRHCKDPLSEKGTETEPALAWGGGGVGRKMSGTWGPLSHDLLGLAPVERRGLLHLKNAAGTPWGRQATELKKHGTSPWLWCPSLPMGTLRCRPQLPPGPRPTGTYTTEMQTPVQAAGGWGGGEGGIISRQLFRSERFRYLCFVSGACISLFCAPFLQVRGCGISDRPRWNSEF